MAVPGSGLLSPCLDIGVEGAGVSRLLGYRGRGSLGSEEVLGVGCRTCTRYLRGFFADLFSCFFRASIVRFLQGIALLFFRAVFREVFREFSVELFVELFALSMIRS